MIINAAHSLGFALGFLLSALLLLPLVWWLLARRQLREREQQQNLMQQLDAEHSLKAHSLQSDLNFANRELARLAQEKEALEAKFNQARSELNSLQQQHAVATQKLEAFEDVKKQAIDYQQLAHQAKEENARLSTQLEQQQQRMAEQLALLADAKQSMMKEFENTANRIFDDKQQRFSLQSKESLELTLSPLRQQLGDFRKRVDDVYGQETADRNRLVGQITELQKQTQKISQDAINLTNALKGDSKIQGNWGEVVLERLLEESGLQKGREYETQVSLKTDSGSRRNPDVIVRLPENKDIIIDAKVSLVDYERFCSADNEIHRAQYLRAHIQSLRNHINGLSFKDYENLKGVRTLDFVFIFVPIEAAFMLALQEDAALFKDAYDKHIILVSPTTLLATLRTVENIWRYEKQNKNAEKIAAQAGALYDQFVRMLESFDDIGKALGRTQEAYDLARNRLKAGKGNLIKRAEDIRKLGAKTKKQLKGDLVNAALDNADQVLIGEAEDDLEGEYVADADTAEL
ncbi:DNA recombination protein RmuC [Simiduia curdlanivorans]|uniref:DNA recombination protein RmuC n=1 Tax=Simiduia curdlanivorans TaxID=1492769 RepID=A0ABV8V9Z1_9GAMM|nr:DNA recombination protein RmuC [Simiduia curdlanivorans]MDN3639710.1 DNA recombination protein RmuC [Simiduia curdlanivorans]